ncbi:MAG: cyclic nucleotide-binding domain-containing protein [Bdellovibrionota bacterium]
MPVIEQLKKSSLFSDCPESSLHKIAKASRLIELAPGQNLFYEGDKSSCFYLVKSGTLVVKKSSSGGEEDLARIGTGSHIGEMTLLNSKLGIYDTRTATAEAAEDSTLVEVPFAILEELIEADAKFGMIFYRSIARNLSARIRKTAEDLTSLKSIHLKHV